MSATFASKADLTAKKTTFTRLSENAYAYTAEGDPNYLSVRMNGSYFRNLRDYGEVGFTRLFPLAPQSWLEASVRGHRVERHYDYSFRILAVAKLRID